MSELKKTESYSDIISVFYEDKDKNSSSNSNSSYNIDYDSDSFYDSDYDLSYGKNYNLGYNINYGSNYRTGYGLSSNFKRVNFTGTSKFGNNGDNTGIDIKKLNIGMKTCLRCAKKVIYISPKDWCLNCVERMKLKEEV